MADRIDRTDCPAFLRIVLAYHEAGHAIVDHAVWPPNPVVRVTIIPTEEHDGVAELGERREAWRSASMTTLRPRYAAGEIDREEYEQKLKDLGG